MTRTISTSLVFSSLIGLTLWAQSFSGRIAGTVTDSTGGVVSGVTVTIVNEGTGAERHLTTDDQGLYVVSELPVGYYTVRFESGGLSTVERQRVKVDVAGETRADATLSARGLDQSLIVRAEAPVLQQDSSVLAEMVDMRQVDSLPLNGRDYRKLAFLVPGAAPRS